MKPTFTVPCGISGWAIRNSAAATTSATPALLSAPSSVVPEAVMMSPLCTIGFTPAPLCSGVVSTCARNPITGTFFFLVVAGTVAIT